MPDRIRPLAALRRFLDNQVAKHGYVRVIWAPIVILAAVGSTLALFGNDWLVFGTVVGGGTAILVLLLLTIERERTTELQERLAKLDSTVEHQNAEIAAHAMQLKRLEGLTESVRWITERMGVCCSAPPGATSIGSHSVGISDICNTSEYDDLESAVLDCARDLLGPVRRLVIYYGDDKRLEPAHKSGWVRGTNPRVLVQGQPRAPIEVNAKALFSQLKRRTGAYVPDVSSPSDEDRLLIQVVPDHDAYRTFACFPLASLPSIEAGISEEGTLLGAFLVQDARVDALGGGLERQLFAVLANVLATGFLSVRAALMMNGGSPSGN